MIVLRNFSQIKNFHKRMSMKHSYHHTEGCGCCSWSSFIEIDNKKKRIILVSSVQSRGSFETTATVLAVIKKRR